MVLKQGLIEINWTLAFQIANTLILFLLMRHFLFKPVKAIIDKRQEEISNAFQEAEDLKSNAMIMEREYESKLSKAKAEASDLLREASKRAEVRSDEIVRNAKLEANRVMDKAHVEIEREKQKAVNDIKGDIAQLATMIATKVIEKDINEADHDKLIHDFIDNVGEAQWQK